MAKFTHTDSSLKSKYWDKFLGDKMNSQAVANAMLARCIVVKDIVDVSGALQFALNNYCKAGLVVDGIIGTIHSLPALNHATSAPLINFLDNVKNLVFYIENYNAGTFKNLIEDQKKAPAKVTTTTTTAKTTTATPAKTTTPVVLEQAAAAPKNNKMLLILFLVASGLAGAYYLTKKQKK